jgi:hypothetical protein
MANCLGSDRFSRQKIENSRKKSDLQFLHGELFPTHSKDSNVDKELEFYLEDIDVDISLETSIVERVNIHHPI